MAEMDMTLAQIEATIAALKQELEDVTSSAKERAWVVEERGIEISEQGHRLTTGGVNEWVAPKIHPVWASEIAHEARMLQQMGSATFAYEPLWAKLDTWFPSPVPYGAYLVMTLLEYERWLRGGEERAAVEQELLAPLRTPGEVVVVNPYGNITTTLEVVAREQERDLVIDTSDQDMGATWQRTLAT